MEEVIESPLSLRNEEVISTDYPSENLTPLPNIPLHMLEKDFTIDETNLEVTSLDITAHGIQL